MYVIAQDLGTKVSVVKFADGTKFRKVTENCNDFQEERERLAK